MPPTSLAAFFDNDDPNDAPAFPQKPLDTHKLTNYATGIIRKSRREKEKEAADAKKREEEEQAAKAYADFLDEFDGPEAGRKRAGTTFVRPGQDSAYAPAAPSRPSGPEHHPASSPSARPHDDLESSSIAPRPKGKRAMDTFLEEIKREQAEREAKYSRHAHGHGRSITALAAYDGMSGSRDRGDSETSNVFVANLPPHVNEQILGQFFARVGPVGSVKVMWPRSDATVGPGADMTASRRTKNSGLSGFVSFMKRKDAEAALREYDGFDWGGSILRVGWSKAVPIAAKAMYTSTTSSRSRGGYNRSRSRSRSQSPLPPRDQYRNQNRSSRRSRSRSRSRSPRWSRSRSPPRRGNKYKRDASRSQSRSRSRSPYGARPRKSSLDKEDQVVTDTFIRAVAAEVKGHGTKYADSLRERERDNPKYAFILDKHHRRHAFYRGLVERERSLSPEFDDQGYNSVYSTDSGEESERERTRKNALGKLARRRFEAMLRALSGKRGELARCMAFSLEHAEAASEVADIILASLLVDSTPVPRKVARLHLICDILHNSAAPVPSAWKFRQEFQSRLGIVFDHLSNIYHSFPGRITAETFKKQFTAVIDIWEDWIVFPPEFTAGLRERLEGGVLNRSEDDDGDDSRNASTSDPAAAALEEESSAAKLSSKFKSSSFQPATAAITSTAASTTLHPSAAAGTSENTDGGDTDGEPMDEDSDIDGKAMSDEDVDGIPMIDDDVDGLPLDDVDGQPMDDVDSAPIDDDVDGAPLEEDGLNGEPTAPDSMS